MEAPDLVDDLAIARSSAITPDTAFQLYVAGGCRSLRKVALTVGLSDNTVRSWSRRYKWSARLRDLDQETLRGVTQSVVVATAVQTLRSLETLAAVRDNPTAAARDHVIAASRILDQWDKFAHLVPQLAPPETDSEDADIIAAVQTPERAAQLLAQHGERAQRR